MSRARWRLIFSVLIVPADRPVCVGEGHASGDGGAPVGLSPAGAVAAVRAGIDALLSAVLERVPGVELAGLVEQVEVQARRLAALDARLLAVLDARGVAGELIRQIDTALRTNLVTPPTHQLLPSLQP